MLKWQMVNEGTGDTLVSSSHARIGSGTDTYCFHLKVSDVLPLALDTPLCKTIAVQLSQLITRDA